MGALLGPKVRTPTSDPRFQLFGCCLRAAESSICGPDVGPAGQSVSAQGHVLPASRSLPSTALNSFLLRFTGEDRVVAHGVPTTKPGSQGALATTAAPCSLPLTCPADTLAPTE